MKASELRKAIVINQSKDNQEESKTVKHPSHPTLSKILKEEFKLKFGKFESASIKYQDVAFDEKRLWISRLLAQFM